MSDTVKLIIEIPKDRYTDILRIADVQIVRRMPTLEQVIANGTPLDTVKAEIKEKCDSIDDIARANIYQYAPHREIQDLLCEILDTFDKHIGEDKE